MARSATPSAASTSIAGCEPASAAQEPPRRVLLANRPLPLIANENVLSLVPPPLSVTRIVTVNSPGEVGVPVMSPAVESVRPAGSELLRMDHV